MTSGRCERFVVAADGARLMARSYAPSADAYPGRGVVLLHGLLSSADLFDVPGLGSMSLARRLQQDGVHVVTYDQRGAGDSTASDWHFGFHAHAEVDLPAVLAECRRRLGFERVVLAGHSLGGTIWLRHLQSAPPRADDGPRVVAGVAIASPAVFDRGHSPWRDLAARGKAFVEGIDHDRDQIVSREEFVAAEILLDWPWAAPLVNRAVLRWALARGGRRRWIAGLLRRLPAPSLIFDRQDFDDETFQQVLRSRTLHRASETLLVELMDEILSGPGAAPTPLALDVLCIGSTLDRLVPLRSVEAFAKQVTRPRVIATEGAYGHFSGHVGYFFKAGLRQHVADEVSAYARRQLA